MDRTIDNKVNRSSSHSFAKSLIAVGIVTIALSSCGKGKMSSVSHKSSGDGATESVSGINSENAAGSSDSNGSGGPGGTTGSGSNEETSTTPKEELQLFKSLKDFDTSSKAIDYIALRDGESFWLVWDSGESKAINKTDLTPLASAFDPCKTLPASDRPYPKVLIRVGSETCWAKDNGSIRIVRHLLAADEERSLSFEFTELEWSKLLPDASSAEIESIRFLGSSSNSAYFANKSDFIWLTLTSTGAQLKVIDLRIASLSGVPEAAAIEWSKEQAILFVTQGSSIIKGTPEIKDGREHYNWHRTKSSIETTNAGSSESKKEDPLRFSMVSWDTQAKDGDLFIFATLKNETSVLLSQNLKSNAGSSSSSTNSTAPNPFQKYCLSCHGPTSSNDLVFFKSDNSIDQVALQANAAQMRERILLGRSSPLVMPPYDPVPSALEIEAMKTALDEALAK